MTETQRATTDSLAKRRRNRRLMFGLLGGGVAVGLLLRWGLGYPLVGEAVYWVGVVGFLAVWFGSSVRLFDERDQALERQASQRTLLSAGAVLALGASATRVLSYTDTWDAPAAVSGFLWGYVALFALFALNYAWLRYR